MQENSVADAWERVAGGAYDPVAKECRELKEQLRLNDWGYYALVRTLSDGFFGKQSAESVVLQSFLMAEAGCKVRLARGGDRLCLLLALDDQVYAKPYFKIDGQTFYLLDDMARAASYNICNFRMPGERPLSLAMPVPPVLAQKSGQPAVRKCGEGALTTTVAVNRNLMDFYTDYPPCYWSIYAATELTPAVRDQLYPTLRSAQAGKGEYDAANLLLHYLHRAFPYKTDEAQFGVERPFDPLRTAGQGPDETGRSPALLPGAYRHGGLFQGRREGRLHADRRRTLCRLRSDLRGGRRGRRDARPETGRGTGRQN